MKEGIISNNQNQSVKEFDICTLQEMAEKQQQKIESQQQILATKEQRLKYLKQREIDDQRVAIDKERFCQLLEKVEQQELKLSRLRALRGQIDQNKINNISLSLDLESIRSLFNEKEKELSLAVAKVEELTRQLEELKQGRLQRIGNSNCSELETLRQELLTRNKMNEDANYHIIHQKHILSQKQVEIQKIDKRIAELQQRLHRKRILNQHLANQITATSLAKAQQNLNHKQLDIPMMIATVEPYQHLSGEEEKSKTDRSDPSGEKSSVHTEDLLDFASSKNDMKYQTLPPNTKFPALLVAKRTEKMSSPCYTPPPSAKNASQEEYDKRKENDQIRITLTDKALKSTEIVKNQTVYLPFQSHNENCDTTQTKPVHSVSPTSIHHSHPPIFHTASSKVVSQHPLFVTSSPQEVYIVDMPQVPFSRSNNILRKGANSLLPFINSKKPILPPKSSSIFKPVIPPRLSPALRMENYSFPLYSDKNFVIQRKEMSNVPSQNSSSVPINSPLIEKIQDDKEVLVDISREPELHIKSLLSNNSVGILENLHTISNGDVIDDDFCSLSFNLMSEFENLQLDFPSIQTPTKNFENLNSENEGKEFSKTDLISPLSDVNAPIGNRRGNLKGQNSLKIRRRVSFDPLALMLDAALEGEIELVKKCVQQVPNPSASNDEGITALHNAVCAGHFEIVQYLVHFGCDVNAQDSDGWTPLHCAASCNNLQLIKYLVENGACIFATTISDHETAAEKCEVGEEGYDSCSEYLTSIQEKLGITNNGTAYALYDYNAHNSDELSFQEGNALTVLRKGDISEREWWWSSLNNEEGYVPRNLLGLYPRFKQYDVAKEDS